MSPSHTLPNRHVMISHGQKLLRDCLHLKRLSMFVAHCDSAGDQRKDPNLDLSDTKACDFITMLYCFMAKCIQKD